MHLSTNEYRLDWPEGVGRRILQQTDSTNAEAARIAQTLAGPEWVLALHQTGARGRRGKAWINPEGNFSATYVMRPHETPAEVALRSFVASLALYDALSAATGRSEGLALKWPNDVLLGGGKVAGILLESFGTGGQVAHLAIGIGVNLVVAPDVDDVEPDAVRPVSLRQETGIRIAPHEFLDVLAPAYSHWEHQFISFGFAVIRHAWLSRAARIGDVITARTGSNQTTGVFETVDETGNLVLSTPQGRQVIAAAEVFFLE